MYFKYQNSRHLLNLIYQFQVFKEHAVSFNKHKVPPLKKYLLTSKEEKRAGRNTTYLDYLKENLLTPIIHSHMMTRISIYF